MAHVLRKCRLEGPISQVALLAEFEVKAQDLDLFLAAAKRELDAVRANEPGCLWFDVVLFDDGNGRGVFVEVFKDQAAADAHRDTPHFTAFFDEISEMDVSWSARHGTVLGTDSTPAVGACLANGSDLALSRCLGFGVKLALLHY